MRRIAIIGAGQAGLIVAHTLLRHGYAVEVYSDRTPDEWLNKSRPTGTAFLFGATIDIERDLDIDLWSDKMPEGDGTLLHFLARPGDEPLVIKGRTERPGGAVDQRLKFHHWMQELEKRGGRIIIESVTPQRLDEIVAGVDLTLIAAGKADLSRLIARDEGRSHFSKPPRRLAMAVVRGVVDWKPMLGFRPVKFNFLGGMGEFFWVPYYHKTAGPTWSGVFEAIPGSPMDIYADCRDGNELVERLRRIVLDFAPWEIEFTGKMEYVSEDPFAWLVGEFAPTVRDAFGRLPSGRLIMPVGDAAITFDPIGGQGGNCASRHAAFVANNIIEHGERPFDEEWMTALRDDFWESDAKWAYNFNNMLLEPPRPGVVELLRRASQNVNVAEKVLINNFLRPKNFYPWILDEQATRDVLARAG